MTKGYKKKRYFLTRNCESASFGRPRGGRWISTASLGSTVEVAEVEQGVGLDPTTPRYFSGDGADTSEDPAGGTLGRDQRGQPDYSCEGQLG